VIPAKIYLPASEYNDLLALLKWEQAMPAVLNGYVGDQFSEMLWLATKSFIPTDLEDEEFIRWIEMCDDNIYVVFGTEDEENDVIVVQVLIKQE
jgi:hypothetical protein